MIASRHLLTERLLLRPPEPQDFEPWAAFVADPVQMRFLGGPMERSAAWRSFCVMAGAWAIQGFAMFSMIERSSGRWIGRTGPWYPEGWPGTEVGWAVVATHQGQGFAYEAAEASMDFAFDVLGWSEVIHVIDPPNLRSRALAERLGSRWRGPTTLPPPFTDGAPVEAWGQTAAEWRLRKR